MQSIRLIMPNASAFGIILLIFLSTYAGQTKAAEEILLVNSVKLGLQFYARVTTQPLSDKSWCDSIVILRVKADNADIFGTRTFHGLIPKVGRLIETECKSAFEVEIHGYGPSDPLPKLLAVALLKEDWKMHTLEP